MANWSIAGDSTGLAETLALLERLRGLAGNLGSDIKPGSRLAMFEQHLGRFNDPKYQPLRDLDFNPVLLSHGARDLRELAFICEKLAPHHSDKLRTALPTLLSGSAVPDDNPRSERPRSLQFEYFLAAQLVHSGFVVALDEPDIVFVHDAESVPVAAKRPIRAGQVVRRVREAVDQLQRVGGGGVVALSLDRLLPVPNPYVGAGSEAALDNAAQTLLGEAFQPHAPRAHKVIRESAITALVVSVSIVGYIGLPWQSAFATATLWLPRDDHLPEESAVVKRVLAALRTPSDPARLTNRK